MITMIENKIDNITVSMTVEETIGSTLGGYPTLHIGLETAMVQEADTLEVYKAIATSRTVEEFCERIQGTWNAWIYECTIKACALDGAKIDWGILAESEANNQILNEIDRLIGLIDDPSISKGNELKCMGKIYDLHKELELIE